VLPRGRFGERVAMRVSQGGHDVPTDKLVPSFPRTQANLAAAIRELSCVWVFDNDDLRTPFRKAGVFENGRLTFKTHTLPLWLAAVMP
ncbi:MAG: hypothetical protein M1608_14360, partial [Candidatus Omnitrophica bacterium]|nr:hypothetical protein [Candidatus Omnitrophota bacterium]